MAHGMDGTVHNHVTAKYGIASLELVFQSVRESEQKRACWRSYTTFTPK
jgi:hypothetical protein